MVKKQLCAKWSRKTKENVQKPQKPIAFPETVCYSEDNPQIRQQQKEKER